MIWHIFKKDASLLWPFSLTLTIAQAVGAALVILLGQFHEPRELALIASFYPYLVFLGIVVLTITAVHLEPLWGVRHDWLMRPIVRSDLLLAKVVFVVLMIHIPIFLVDVAEQLVLRFSLVESIESAASRGLELVCTLTLPALLLGAVTESLMDALLFGLMVGLGCTCVYMSIFIFAMKPPELPSGVMWVATTTSQVFILIGAALTLALAYSKRRLWTTRVTGVLVVLAAVAIVGWFPFKPAFAIQETVSRNWVGQKPIELRFGASVQEPAAPTEALPADVAGQASISATAANRALIGNLMDASHSIALVRLPLQILGLSRNGILFADWISVRITGSDGTPLYQGAAMCVRIGNGMGRACRANSLEVSEKQSDADVDVEQQLNLPAATFLTLKDRPVTVELDYALTLLNPGPTQTLAAIGDERHLAGLGSCATRIDADGDEVELRCRSATAAPSCAAALLVDSKSGLRNPLLEGCRPNYVLFPQSGIEDVLNPFGLSLPFRDLSGLAHYPIDGSRIQSARVFLTAYYPTAHLRRSLVIPNIRLRDWEATRSPMRAKGVGN